jgi:O-antigen ligase
MGVSAGPNGLATTCFVCGLVVLWNLFRKDTSETRVDRGIDVLMLLMIVWLLNKADGNTAFLSLVIALAIMLGLRRGLLTALVSGLARHMVAFLTVIAVSLALMYVWVIDALGAIVGSSATLWGRVELWKLLVSLSGNPILGMGYGNFWLGDRMQSLWAIYSWHPTQAHNGYLETYLNLGFLGVVLLIVLLASACRKATTPALLVDLRILKLSYMLPVVLYNLTEAAFRGLHIVWFVFLVLAMETQQQFLKGPSQAKPLQQPVGGGNRSAGRRWPATEAAMATRRTSSRAAGTRFARALR